MVHFQSELGPPLYWLRSIGGYFSITMLFSPVVHDYTKENIIRYFNSFSLNKIVPSTNYSWVSTEASFLQFISAKQVQFCIILHAFPLLSHISLQMITIEESPQCLLTMLMSGLNQPPLASLVFKNGSVFC